MLSDAVVTILHRDEAAIAFSLKLHEAVIGAAPLNGTFKTNSPPVFNSPSALAHFSNSTGSIAGGSGN